MSLLKTCGLSVLLALCVGAAAPGDENQAGSSSGERAIATPSSGTAIDAASPPPEPPPLPIVNPSSSQSVVDATLIPRPGDGQTTLASKASAWSLRDLGPLAAVLGLILLVALVVRRLARTGRGRSAGPLCILQRAFLSPKQSINLVRVGRRVIVVGVTPERISTLFQIDDPEECAWLLSAAGAKREDALEFERFLAEEADAYQGGPIEAGALRGARDARLREVRGSLRGVLDRLRPPRRGASAEEEASETAL